MLALSVFVIVCANRVLSSLAREALDKDAAIFTAHMDLSYRRPLKAKSEYLVEVCVDRVERQKMLGVQVSG